MDRFNVRVEVQKLWYGNLNRWAKEDNNDKINFTGVEQEQ